MTSKRLDASTRGARVTIAPFRTGTMKDLPGRGIILLCRLAAQRERHRDPGAGPGLRGDVDPGAVFLRDPPRDREPQPGPVRIAARRLGAVEPVEYERELVGRDSDTGVGDDDGARSVLSGNVEVDAASPPRSPPPRPLRRGLDPLFEPHPPPLSHQGRVPGDFGLPQLAPPDPDLPVFAR